MPTLTASGLTHTNGQQAVARHGDQRRLERQLYVLRAEWTVLAVLSKGVFVGFQNRLGDARHTLFVRIWYLAVNGPIFPSPVMAKAKDGAPPSCYGRACMCAWN